MIAHPQDMDYAYRGKAVKDLSLVEYACVIEIVKQCSDKEQSESLHTGDADASSTAVDSALQYDRESERNTCYPFDVMHPLFETHTQMVRTKLFIPLLCGGKPPNLQRLFQKISNKEPLLAREKHKLDRGIKYYMTLLSPWTLQQSTTQRAPTELLPMHGTTYLDFCKFVEELDGKVYDEQNKTYSMKAYPLSTKNLLSSNCTFKTFSTI